MNGLGPIRSRAPPTAACASVRWCAQRSAADARAPPDYCAAQRARCFPAPLGSCATVRPPPVTRCSARAVRTSTTAILPSNKRPAGGSAARALGSYRPPARDPRRPARLLSPASERHGRGAAHARSTLVVGRCAPGRQVARAASRWLTSIARPETPQVEHALGPAELIVAAPACRRRPVAGTYRKATAPVRVQAGRGRHHRPADGRGRGRARRRAKPWRASSSRGQLAARCVRCRRRVTAEARNCARERSETPLVERTLAAAWPSPE